MAYKDSTIWQKKVLCGHFLFSFWTVCQFWTVTVRLILPPAESPISLPNLRKLITAKSTSDHQQPFLIINACAKSSQTESQVLSKDTEMCIITAQTKLPIHYPLKLVQHKQWTHTTRYSPFYKKRMREKKNEILPFYSQNSVIYWRCLNV